jgi:hypothetical protein
VETQLTRTAHPAVHLAVGAWHTRRSRRLVNTVDALLPDVATAVEHLTGQAMPLTVVHINSLAVAALTIETGAHRSHLGRQPLPRVLKHIARSWLGLLLTQARTVRYDHPTVQVFLNPVLLRHVDDDELVRVLGHELVHGVQLVHPASTGYGADVANNYRIAQYTPLQAAEADAVVALHEAAAYRLEDQIVEVTRWHQAGLLGEPKIDLAVHPTQPVTDLIDHVDALTSRAPQYAPLQLLEELRDAAPVAEIADLVDNLVHAFNAEGQYLIADRLEEAQQQLRAASELLVEGTEPNAVERYLRDILGDDGEFAFKTGDVDDTADADPVSLVGTMHRAGVR